MPDWRRHDAYRPLLEADATVWAWEFARRAKPADPGADDWARRGLCRLVPGPSGDSRPVAIWDWREDRAVPRLIVRPVADFGAGLGLKDLPLPVLVVGSSQGQQHVTVCDRERRFRFIVTAGDILAGPVECFVLLPPGPSTGSAAQAMRVLAGLRDEARLVGMSGATPRSGRWLDALRALDAKRAGASQRQVAEAMFGPERVSRDWAGASDYMRMRIQRLTRSAERLAKGGYRSLVGLGQMAGDPLETVEVWRSEAWSAPARSG